MATAQPVTGHGTRGAAMTRAWLTYLKRMPTGHWGIGWSVRKLLTQFPWNHPRTRTGVTNGDSAGNAGWLCSWPARLAGTSNCGPTGFFGGALPFAT